MIAMLFLVILASIAPAIYISAKKRRFYFPFLVLLCYYCLQIPLLLYSQVFFPAGDIYKASMMVCVANSLLSLFLIILDSRIPSERHRQAHYDELAPQWTVAAFAIVASVFVLGKLSQGELAFQNVWLQRIYSEGGLLTPIITISAFLIFVLWTPLQPLLKFTLLPMLFFAFVTTGGRLLFMVVAGWAWYWVLQRYRLRTILLLAPIGIAVLLFFHVMGRITRSLGLSGLLAGDLNVIVDQLTTEPLDVTGGEATIAEALVLAIQLRDAGLWQAPPFATLIRILLLPIPTSVAPFKPDDVTYTLFARALEFGYFDFDRYFRAMLESYSVGQYGSLHPTIWGDAILNAGWAGCLIWPVLLALGLFYVERTLITYRETRFAIMFAGISAAALVYVMRGNVFLGISCYIVLPLVWFVTWPRRSGRGADKAALRLGNAGT